MMDTNQKGFRSVFVGFYPWVTAVFFGGILLDIVYANLLRGIYGSSESTAVFSDVADFLLLIGAVAVLAAIVAILFSWGSKVVSSLFIASLLILGLEFLGPLLLIPFIQNMETLNIGPLLRILPSGLASALAFIGLFKYSRQG
jgi:hypothetical protein